jgi:hypothetical protein
MNKNRNHQKTFYFLGDEKQLRAYYVDQVCDCLGKALTSKYSVEKKMVAGSLVWIGFDHKLNFFYDKKVDVPMPDGKVLRLVSVRRKDVVSRPVGV